MATKPQVTGWVGWVYFAAFMLVISGVFQTISGLVALFDNGFYVAVGGVLAAFDLNTWGWIHLLLGIVTLMAGTALFSGRMWARVFGVILASASAIAYFGFLSTYPLWSTIVITVNILIIYALTVHGGEAAIDE